VADAKNVPAAFRDTFDAHDKLAAEHADLRTHCTNLEQLVALYATALNELAIENQVLREEASERGATVTPLPKRGQARHQQT
jgi:hypothetical protein